MSRVLLCGSRGFIGRHIAAQLRAQGHEVLESHRLGIDFSRDLAPADWRPRLAGLDAVVNAVGVLRSSAARPMEAVHHRAPAALFEACAEQGLRRVIHVSALGIEGSATEYARSKRAGDAVLLSLREQGRLDGCVLRPSIVFGRGGASSRMFMQLARLPLLVLPAAALRARVQPVAVQDLAQVCARLLAAHPPGPALLHAVGPRALTLAEFVAVLRRADGAGPARVLALPDWLSRASARAGDHLPMQPWCRETLALLQQDNVADAAPFQAWLERPPIAPEQLRELAWDSV